MGDSNVDRFDVLALIGLVLLNIGLAAIYWPLAPLITGTLLLLAVVRLALSQERREQGGNINQSGEARD